MDKVVTEESNRAMAIARKVDQRDARIALRAATLAGDMAVAAYLQKKFFATPDEVVAVAAY